MKSWMPVPGTTENPFSSLKDVLFPETLKAITVKPFKLTSMTAVQEEVLSLLPDLAATTLSPTIPNLPPPAISPSVNALARTRHQLSLFPSSKLALGLLKMPVKRGFWTMYCSPSRTGGEELGTGKCWGCYYQPYSGVGHARSLTKL
ncbi:uncharacterized protein ARMOST_13972 [Armillaria ostoyae]|uniref:Uncharacterized protein n=1 Tax=Armillaria ostoyae TaxID=47428 RepID=A0A284RPB4_ARMOS|nr:uncharacterized protein ARMOST_13972 [Armillaria ostoyae]